MTDNPFDGLTIEEIHLPRAPLVHVVAQVVFPLQLELRTEAGLARFATALKDTYPVLHPEQPLGLALGTDNQVSQPVLNDVIWRLQDREKKWRVSVSPTFVALDTSSYISRTDFLERLKFVLDSLSSVVDPILVERIGIRYIDRIDDPALFGRISELVRPELLGGLSVPTTDEVQLEQTISQSVFSLNDHKLLVRWAMLPPNVTPDPLVGQVDRQSWVLDVDSVSQVQSRFETEQIISRISEFAAEIYKFFRWAVTSELLSHAAKEE